MSRDGRQRRELRRHRLCPPGAFRVGAARPTPWVWTPSLRDCVVRPPGSWSCARSQGQAGRASSRWNHCSARKAGVGVRLRTLTLKISPVGVNSRPLHPTPVENRPCAHSWPSPELGPFRSAGGRAGTPSSPPTSQGHRRLAAAPGPAQPAVPGLSCGLDRLPLVWTCLGLGPRLQPGVFSKVPKKLSCPCRPLLQTPVGFSRTVSPPLAVSPARGCRPLGSRLCSQDLAHGQRSINKH